jgi:hypothetical protein
MDIAKAPAGAGPDRPDNPDTPFFQLEKNSLNPLNR